nr:MAG TPA: hypothetical protein [Caudoviricetes sp.]
MTEKNYKFNLIYEYREVVAKVQNLERFITNNEQKTLTESDEKRLALLREQIDILKQYENILAKRIEFEM